MTRNDDDIFKPKLGRMRSRGNAKAKNYINRVLQQISAAGETGFGAARSRRFTGARIGRGNDVLRRYRAGYRFGPASRRVVIKSRIVKLTGTRSGKGIGAARAHLRYIQRDGVTKEHEPGRLYDANGDEADGGAFLERSEGDRHQFRFIVSPEDAPEMSDLRPFVRDLMETIEGDLGTKLDWVAADHFDTGHPHTHIVLRGKDDQGKDLIIARDYIAHGMRRRASELLTLELGPQSEQEIRRKLEHQIEQNRFTDLDRQLVRQVQDGVLEIRRGQETDTRLRNTLQAVQDRTDARFRHATQIARLRALERRGLAKEIAPGQWRLSDGLEETLHRAGERGDIIKTMHRGLKAAGVDAVAADYCIYDSGDPRTQTITGRIIDRGLHDELNDGHYITVDAADGRIHFVVLDPHQDLDDLPLGAIVEVQPAAGRLKPSDRTIAEVAKRNGGIYSPELHYEHGGEMSEDFIKAHVRRLEALRRQNIVRRFADGSWEIPDDFENRVAALAGKNSRYPQRVLTLSYLSLNDQVTAGGATWLDHELVGSDSIEFRGDRFGSAASAALGRRQEHLVEQGLANRLGGEVRYRRNLLRLLRRREMVAVGDRLAKVTGKIFVETADGSRAEGVYRRSVRLASGKFAILENTKEFTLVPWRSVLERQRGKKVVGLVGGSSTLFEISPKRTIGLT